MTYYLKVIKMSYKSKSRLSQQKFTAEITFNQNDNIIGQPEIRQPRPRISAEQYANRIQSFSSIQNGSIKDMADWLDKNGHPVIPEHTSHPNSSPVEDTAVVISLHGNEPLRTKACTKAIQRLLRADPQPARFIIIEALNEGNDSNFSFLKDYKNVTFVRKTIKDQNKNLFQKEALWTIGTRFVFKHPSISKCILVDADCSFDDNSWVYIISKDLNKYDFVQPYVGVNYSEQVGYKHGPSHLLLSNAYGISVKSSETLAPGGAYACTKKFFEEILNNQWPYNALGSGDVAFWYFMRGRNTNASKLVSAILFSGSPKGNYPQIPVGYSNLILNHYYHGPFSNRMYITRDYLAKKYNSDKNIKIDDDGLIAWANTTEGNIFKECTEELRKKTDAYLQVNRKYSVYDAKLMTSIVSNKHYGSFTDDNPLIITTIYSKDYDASPKVITNMYKALCKNCTNPFEFIVFTDTQIDSLVKQYPITLDRRVSPDAWRRLYIFSKDYGPESSVLFIDPSTEIKGQFNISRCPNNHIYLAKKSTGMWSSSMMYFRNIPSLYKQYMGLISGQYEMNPTYLYLDPAYYIISNILYKNVMIKNLITHVDYRFKDEPTDTPVLYNFVLE